MHRCHQIPTAFELLIENFFPLIENISKCTFPRLFPGCFPGALFFSFSLFNIPTSIARDVFFLNLLLLCRVFPGCFPGVSGHNFLSLSFTLLKIPTTFAKEAPLIQNISKCTFPWCFPGISWVFPGCSRAFFFAHSCFC